MTHTHPISKHTARAYSWGRHCKSFILTDTEQLSVKEELMPPHSSEQLHLHEQAQQFFYILEGEASFYINGETLLLTKHQGISVEPGTPHFIANTSDTELTFLVISQPSTDHDRINIE